MTRLATIRQNLIDQKNSFWADHVEIQRLSVAAWIARAEEKHDESLKLMRAAADLEASTEKHPVTPGAILPARELLAELLLDLGKKEDAIAEAQRVSREAPKRRSTAELMEKAQK